MDSFVSKTDIINTRVCKYIARRPKIHATLKQIERGGYNTSEGERLTQACLLALNKASSTNLFGFMGSKPNPY